MYQHETTDMHQIHLWRILLFATSLVFVLDLTVAGKSKKESTKRDKWPQRDDEKRDDCQIDVNKRQDCKAKRKTDCQRKGCCWESERDRRDYDEKGKRGSKSKKGGKGGKSSKGDNDDREDGQCFTGKDNKLPRSCQEVYKKVSTKSGVYELQAKKGDAFQVYCLFIDGRTGYVFPGREAVKNLKNVDIGKVASDHSHVLIIRKQSDGAVLETIVKPLRRFRKKKLSFFHNSYGSFKPATLENKFGPYYIYVGFLNKRDYEKKREDYELGFTSGNDDLTYRDCDGNANNYMAFFSNPSNKRECKNVHPLGIKFTKGFKTSKHTEVVANEDFHFSLEAHFGGCGMFLTDSCYDNAGYAVGLPFGKHRGGGGGKKSYGPQCRCSGDPHCYSFDGKKTDFMGACQYTAVQDGCEGGMYQGTGTFRIIADFYPRSEKSVTFVKGVTIDILGVGKIELTKDNKVLVKGVETTTVPGGHAEIRKSYDTVVVRLQNGVEVTWLYKKRQFTVDLPTEFQTKVCGLCGNYNDDKEDDWIMGSGELCTNRDFNEGHNAATHREFGISWIAAIDDDDRCSDECVHVDDPDPECPEDQLNKAKTHCGALFDPTGRFEECLQHIDPSELEDLVEECEYDTCIVGDPDNSLLCTQAATLVHLCLDEYGITVDQWRKTDFCPLECPANMEYLDCGSADQPTCLDEVGSYDGPCLDGCFCQEGFVADGDRCIKPEECGCEYNSQTYKVGDSVLVDDCQKLCTCQADGAMTCPVSQCDENSMCTIIDGHAACVCPPNYDGDGKSCQPKSADCQVSDKGHFETFDGYKFDFLLGVCQYVIAQDGCSGGSGSFKLVADFYKTTPRDPVSTTKALYLTVFNPDIQISLLDSGEVQKNGITINNLPATLATGLTIARVSGTGEIVIVLPSGVQISWWPESLHYTVTAPTSKQGTLCGLCGNFNMDVNDDQTMGPKTCPNQPIMKPGQVTTSPNFLGVSWLSDVDMDAGCLLECENVDNPDPECTLAEQDLAHDNCFPLSDVNGAFADCIEIMDIVDLIDLLKYCVYDSCIDTAASEETFCLYAEKLSELCTKKYDRPVLGWRDEDNCPLTCGPNMKYRSCGSPCQPSCADHSPICTAVCEEGCFCQEGYVLLGDACVGPEECGCKRDGLLYQVGEEVLSEDCTKSCKCEAPNSAMVCHTTSCHGKAYCTISEGSRACVCKAPYAGDGVTSCTYTPPPIEENPCKAPPLNCKVVSRGKCAATWSGQTCGVGLMTEERWCYYGYDFEGPYDRQVVNRNCCLAHCPPAAANPQGPTSPEEPGSPVPPGPLSPPGPTGPPGGPSPPGPPGPPGPSPPGPSGIPSPPGSSDSPSPPGSSDNPSLPGPSVPSSGPPPVHCVDVWPECEGVP